MPRIILIGLPGSGKSTVARALARNTGLTVSDTDHLIEERAGKKISTIFEEDGEVHFRELEAQIVDEALLRESGILALGGGSVLNSGSRDAIKRSGAPVIYLNISTQQADVRVGKNSDRPLLQGNSREKLEALLSERAPLYESLATFTIRTDSKKASEVADEIMEAIGLESVKHA
jgi:shikimate kinase